MEENLRDLLDKLEIQSYGLPEPFQLIVALLLEVYKSLNADERMPKHTRGYLEEKWNAFLGYVD